MRARQGTNGLERSRRSGGFSLIETVIALAILAYGVMGVTAGQILAMKHASDSRIHKIAMYLAEQQMEIFHVMSSDDVIALGSGNDAGNPIDPDGGDGTAMTFDRSWTIAENTPEVGVITITVEVDWTDANNVSRTARLQSIKADM